MLKQSFYINTTIPGKKTESSSVFSELKFRTCNSSIDLEAVGNNVELNSSNRILCPQH